MRRLLIRTGLLLLLIALGAFLFVNGKGHDVLLDNKTVTIGDKTFEAFPSVRISLDGGKAVEMQRRERLQDMLVGSSHTIHVEVLNRAANVVQSVDASFSLGLAKMYLLSIPALVSGDAGWLQEFRN